VVAENRDIHSFMILLLSVSPMKQSYAELQGNLTTSYSMATICFTCCFSGQMRGDPCWCRCLLSSYFDHDYWWSRFHLSN